MDKKNNEIEPDKAIKYLPIFYTVVILFFVLIALASHNLIEKPENDLFNVTTLVLEVMFGILITWTVYIYSKKWKKENEKITDDIKKITDDISQLTKNVEQTVSEESKIRKEIVFDLSYHLNGKLDLTIRSLKHSLEMFENYKNNKDGKSDIWKEIMLNAYTRTQHYIDLKMNLLELMKIYGTHIARMYWRLIGDLQITSSMYSELDERNIHEFAKFVEEGLFQAEELKKMIEPLGSNRPD